MKKYKLIKEYPGFTLPNECYSIDGTNPFYCKNRAEYIINPHQYPKFWELVVEKDYEILSFKHEKGYAPLYKQRNGNFRINDMTVKYDGFSESSLLNDKHWNIHSVKRLSDGEVFTIGDKVMYDNTSNIFIINYFTFYNKKQTQIVAGNSIAKDPDEADWSIINNLIKYKQPLFTTEDGADIFNGDEYYTIFDDKHIICPSNIKSFGINGPFIAIDNKYYNTLVKYFSNKKAAENWVKCHKPVLTLNEVLNIIKNEDDTDSMKTKLTKLVKEKLHKS